MKQLGGKRQGAGRPKSVPDTARRRLVSCTDRELAEIKKLLQAMRKGGGYRWQSQIVDEYERQQIEQAH